MPMKSTRLLILLALLSSPCVLSAADSLKNSAQIEYAKAVKSYVDAASEHLQALRTEIDAQLKDAGEETKKGYENVYAALSKCEKLVANLKNADPVNFDRVKADFEAARGKLLKEVEVARKG